ncbi:hypothetical protein BGZ65_006837, partial [Modicella reniformis]
MKIDPSVWRSEQHQREIYRLMHEGREEEVMKRRGVRNVMDTMTEEDEDEQILQIQQQQLQQLQQQQQQQQQLQQQLQLQLLGSNASGNMSGVVQTVVDFGGFKSSEEREKELIRQQVRQEWAKLVEEQTGEYEQMLQQEDSRRRNSWPRHLSQQQVQFKMMPSQ